MSRISIVADFDEIRRNIGRGGPEQDPVGSEGDDQILVLFREWLIAVRHANSGIPEHEDDAVLDIACDRVTEIEDAIAGLPCAGVVGLSIKIFLLHHKQFPLHQPADGCGLGSGSPFESSIEKSVIGDAVRFVPELAPLCAEVLAAVEVQGDPS